MGRSMIEDLFSSSRQSEAEADEIVRTQQFSRHKAEADGRTTQNV